MLGRIASVAKEYGLGWKSMRVYFWCTRGVRGRSRDGFSRDRLQGMILVDILDKTRGSSI